MRAVIVCDYDVMISMLIGNISATGPDASRVVGTSTYCKEWIDRYIAKLFLETTEPIHVFNAYHGSQFEAPCDWAREVISRLNAFSSAGIIPAPIIHDGSAWITPLRGFQRRMLDFHWGEIVVARDHGSDVVLVEDGSNYKLESCTPSSGDTDRVCAHKLTSGSDQLETALLQVASAFEAQALGLDLPQPEIDRDILCGWAGSHIDPATCVCLLKTMFNEHPAFSDDLLSPLTDCQNENENAALRVTIIRRDCRFDNGIGVDAAGGEGFYIVSYGLGGLGDMLVAGVEHYLASQDAGRLHGVGNVVG